MKNIVKELIGGIIGASVLLAVVKVGGMFIEWILSSQFKTGLVIGLGAVIVVKLLLNLASE